MTARVGGCRGEEPAASTNHGPDPRRSKSDNGKLIKAAKETHAYEARHQVGREGYVAGFSETLRREEPPVVPSPWTCSQTITPSILLFMLLFVTLQFL